MVNESYILELSLPILVKIYKMMKCQPEYNRNYKSYGSYGVHYRRHESWGCVSQACKVHVQSQGHPGS